MNTFANAYDAVDEADKRVAFINHAVCYIGEHSHECPMPKDAWVGLFYFTQDIMDILNQAKRLYQG